MSRLAQAALALLGATLFNSTRNDEGMIEGCPLPPREGWVRAKILSMPGTSQEEDKPRPDGQHCCVGGFCYVDLNSIAGGMDGDLVAHSLRSGSWYLHRFQLLEKNNGQRPDGSD